MLAFKSWPTFTKCGNQNDLYKKKVIVKQNRCVSPQLSAPNQLGKPRWSTNPFLQPKILLSSALCSKETARIQGSDYFALASLFARVFADNLEIEAALDSRKSLPHTDKEA